MLDAQTQRVAHDIPWWYVPLFTAVLAGFAAYVGGMLGVTWEGKKLAKQRAFDYQLKWYMRLERSLSAVSDAYTELSNEKDLDKRRQSQDRLVQGLLKLNRAKREAMMFAPATTLVSIGLLKLAIDEVLKDAGAEHRDAALSEIASVVMQVHIAISNDVREFLGLRWFKNRLFQRNVKRSVRWRAETSEQTRR